MTGSKKPVPAASDAVALVERQLDDDKALDILVIDIRGRTNLADYMVIASGTSQRHIGAMTEHLREKLKALGVRGLSVEGEMHCDWVLLDAGDVIVHLFRPEVRDFYNLEKMWGVAAPAAPAAPDQASAGQAGAQA